MFTGIIEHCGNVISINGNQLVIEATFPILTIGESIAVNGVCLTLLTNKDHLLSFDLSPETRVVTALNTLKPGSIVNLEQAMLVTARFGGHYVSGHVDTKSNIKEIKKIDNFIELVIGDFSLDHQRFLVPKGSITLDGVSLTINSIHENCIKLMLVPHTLANTTLNYLHVGQEVNVEFDYFARIVVHQLSLSNYLKNEVVL